MLRLQLRWSDTFPVIASDLWRDMPKEIAEQIFAVYPMKTMAQGVAALDPKLAGRVPHSQLKSLLITV